MASGFNGQTGVGVGVSQQFQSAANQAGLASVNMATPMPQGPFFSHGGNAGVNLSAPDLPPQYYSTTAEAHMESNTEHTIALLQTQMIALNERIEILRRGSHERNCQS
ncbi:hypothetical protein H4R33_006934, partial [Dimargaris cristalligena]